MSKLVKWDDPVLYNQTERFDFQNPQIDPEKLLSQLSEELHASKGIGLSANQIGIPLNVCVIGGPDEIIPVFNPLIVDKSDNTMVMNESCLSFPGFFVSVARHLQIRVRFSNQKGITNTVKFENLTARIFQHEIDHLQGKTILKNMSRLQIERTVKKLLKQSGNPCKYEIGKLWTLVRT